MKIGTDLLPFFPLEPQLLGLCRPLLGWSPKLLLAQPRNSPAELSSVQNLCCLEFVSSVAVYPVKLTANINHQGGRARLLVGGLRPSYQGPEEKPSKLHCLAAWLDLAPGFLPCCTGGVRNPVV